MKRYLAVFVLVAFCPGCAALQRTPDASVLQSLQTIAVLPLAGHAPISSTSPWYSGAAGNVAGAALLIVLGPFLLIDSATRAAAIPEGALTLEREPQGDNGRLTVALARAAAETLQEQGARNIYLVDGYLRLPMADTAMSPEDVQFEERTRLRRWYEEKMARVDYGGMSIEGIDAILEVGLSDYGCPNNEANCAVQLRLVNPATKEVLGRATHQTHLWKIFWWWEERPTPEHLANLAKDKGREAIMECLKDLGLFVE